MSNFSINIRVGKKDLWGLGAESWFVVASYAFAEMTLQCTEVRFSSLFSGGFITAIIVNPPERKLANAPLCIGGSFWQKHSLLQQTMTLLQGPKDTILPTLSYIALASHKAYIALQNL